MTNVQATVTDSDGQVWFGGTWSIIFVPNPDNPVVTNYNINGIPLDPTVLTQSGVMDASGHFSVSLYDNTKITPINSSWRLTVCPQSSAQCGFYNFSTTSANIDISGALTFLIPPPRFLGVYPNYGYSDLEVILSSKPGSTYYNVMYQCQRYYNSNTSQWACVTFQPPQPVPPIPIVPTFPMPQLTFTNSVVLESPS